MATLKRSKRIKGVFLLLCVLTPIHLWAKAQEEAGQQDAAMGGSQPIYIPLKPPFIVNYGGKGDLQYLKTEISVRVSTPQTANAIRHHMPYIRNNLVLLFSRQKDIDVDTQEGKERLRLAALEEVRQIILQEDKVNDIDDLYFSTFILQK